MPLQVIGRYLIHHGLLVVLLDETLSIACCGIVSSKVELTGEHVVVVSWSRAPHHERRRLLGCLHVTLFQQRRALERSIRRHGPPDLAQLKDALRFLLNGLCLTEIEAHAEAERRKAKDADDHDVRDMHLVQLLRFLDSIDRFTLKYHKHEYRKTLHELIDGERIRVVAELEAEDLRRVRVDDAVLQAPHKAIQEAQPIELVDLNGGDLGAHAAQQTYDVDEAGAARPEPIDDGTHKKTRYELADSEQDHGEERLSEALATSGLVLLVLAIMLMDLPGHDGHEHAGPERNGATGPHDLRNEEHHAPRAQHGKNGADFHQDCRLISGRLSLRQHLLLEWLIFLCLQLCPEAFARLRNFLHRWRRLVRHVLIDRYKYG